MCYDSLPLHFPNATSINKKQLAYTSTTPTQPTKKLALRWHVFLLYTEAYMIRPTVPQIAIKHNKNITTTIIQLSTGKVSNKVLNFLALSIVFNALRKSAN